jgi:FkbM family methyltransferase
MTSMATQAKRFAEHLWYARGKVPVLRAPFPVRLPYGGWFWAYGDAMGARVTGYRLAGHPYEEAQWKLVRRLLGPGGVMIDVGANQGFYSLLGSRTVGPTGRVFAFEPAITERRKLHRNLALNRCRNVVVEPLAVGSEEGSADFYLCLGHQGSWSSLREPAADMTAKSQLVQVDITTLDAYSRRAGLEDIDLIKIDVEGGELNVLRGATDVLDRFRPVLLCEVEDRRTHQWGYASTEIVDFVRARGYDWYQLDVDGYPRRASRDGGGGGWENLAAIHSATMMEFSC